MAEINENPETSQNNQTGAEQPEDIQQGQVNAEVSKDARMWAMFCHLAGLCAFILPAVGNIVGPLILWQIKKEQYPFVDEQGKEALNFQISITIYALISAVLTVICVGFFLLAAVAVVDFIFLLIAAVKANSGQSYRYPLTIRFVR